MTNARLEELRAKFQENPRRYFAPFANELRKSGDPAQAIAICRTHLATQPGHVSGHIVLGQALYEAGSATEARDVFAAALELDPENLIALRTLGEIAQVNGEFDGARQWYQRLLDADPRNHEVAHLLRDLPKESTSTRPAPSPEPATEEPTPLSLREEAAAAEPEPPVPIPASSFHTSFTGSGRAYDPDEPRPEAESAPDREMESHSEPLEATANAPTPSEDVGERAPFIDLEVSAYEEQRDTPPYSDTTVSATAATSEEPPAAELIDFESFAEDPVAESFPDEATLPAEEPVAESLPDEATLAAEVPGDDDSRFAPPAPDVAADVDEFGAMPEAPAAGSVPNDFAATPGNEPVRAMFAEHGFDGPTDGDEVGWLTTPSAAYSDLEAAPEDWFDATPGAVIDEEEVVASDSASAAQPGAPDDPATDSWFDDAGGASTIEPTDVSNDEFWLPPELPQVTAAEDNTRSSAEPEDVTNPTSAEPMIEPQAEPLAAASAVEAVGEFGEPGSELTEPEWQPATNEDEVRAGHESESAPVVASWDHEAVESPDSRQDTPDELRDVHDVAAAAEEVVFVAHAGVRDEAPSATPGAEVVDSSSAEAEEAAAQAEAQEPAIPVYSAATSSDVASLTAQPDVPAETAPTSAPDPFITETLAELYLKQGFRDEALSIYRQLLQREPANTTLRDRITSLESGADAEPAAPEATEQSRVASQSVRTFFSRLARRQPAVPVLKPAEPDVPFASAASALANMFAASRPNPTDESAASALSGAFTDPTGRPSRAADRELSLDHLFREVAPRETQGGGGALSLDEFYSTPNAAAGSPTEPEATTEEASGSDIRQFTAWLEGLRKK